MINRVPYLGVFHRDTVARFSPATALAMVAMPVANGAALGPCLFEQRFVCRWSARLTGATIPHERWYKSRKLLL